MRDIRFEGISFAEFCEWQSSGDKSAFLKLVRMIEETRRTPFQGIGKPEALKGNLRGYWSRRIDQENRMVYAVLEDCISIYSLKGHYTR